MRVFLYTAALTAMACVSAHAQTLNARATVPFNFRMGETVMPAGEYRVQQSGGLLTLREETGRKAAMHLTSPASRKAVSPKPSLEFKRYGNEFYLEKVWAGLSHEGQALIPGKREKELAARFRKTEAARVVLEAKSK
jgi:hypothetical protein